MKKRTKRATVETYQRAHARIQAEQENIEYLRSFPTPEISPEFFGPHSPVHPLLPQLLDWKRWTWALYRAARRELPTRQRKLDELLQETPPVNTAEIVDKLRQGDPEPFFDALALAPSILTDHTTYALTIGTWWPRKMISSPEGKQARE